MEDKALESVKKWWNRKVANETSSMLFCICEKMEDDMAGRWVCPIHGRREPNYDR